nr:MAG TPA: hypothetical protein [Caudoviricetes sp.]
MDHLRSVIYYTRLKRHVKLKAKIFSQNIDFVLLLAYNDDMRS